MKKTIFKSALSIMAVIALLAGCGAETKTGAESSAVDTANVAQGVTVVKVGTMGTYNPYSYQDENGTLTGYDLEVLRKVQEIDPTLQFEFVAGPWDSLFVGLDAGKFEMLGNQVTSTKERQEKYYLSENDYYVCVDQIIVKAGRTDINSFEDLVGKKIGLTVGDGHNAVVEEWNEANGNVLTLEYYEQDISTVLQEIENGRIDATINDPAVAESKAEIQGLGVQAVGERLSASPTYFIFPKTEAGKRLQKKVDAALTTMKENGELSALSQEWFGADFTR